MIIHWSGPSEASRAYTNAASPRVGLLSSLGAVVHESADDLVVLQRILDRSFAHAGAHLRAVFRHQRAMTAADVVATLKGVFILHLATVSKSNRPVVAPIDGLFYRARFLFSAPEQSKRVAHLRRQPDVSATYTQGEGVCIIVHGRAVEVGAADAEVRAFFEEVYGAEILEASAKPGLTAFIEPRFMVAFGASRVAG